MFYVYFLIKNEMWCYIFCVLWVFILYFCGFVLIFGYWCLFWCLGWFFLLTIRVCDVYLFNKCFFINELVFCGGGIYVN